MKHYIQILIFLICTTFCHAQQHKIDSLNRLIPKATSDTQRINLVIKKAAAFRYVNLDSAIQLDNKLVQKCESINYKLGELRATIDLAHAFTEKDDIIAAKKNLNKANGFFKTIKDSASLLDYYNQYGGIYQDDEKLDSSIIFFKKAISVIPSDVDAGWLASIYDNIGNVYLQSANFPFALTYFQKAVSIDEKVNNKENISDIYLGMCSIFYEMGDTAKSIQYNLYAIKLAVKNGDTYGETNAEQSIGNTYFALHKYKESYNYEMNAAALAKKTIASQDLEAQALTGAAEALAKLNKMKEAEKLNRKAMLIADSLNEPDLIRSTYSTMGDILKMEGKEREAIPFYEKSRKSNTISELYSSVADNYDSLSRCYENTGNFSKALKAYKTATRIRDTLRNQQNVRKTTELEVSYEFKKKQALAKVVQDRKDADTKRKKIQQYFIIAGLAIIVLAFVAIALIQFRNNKQKQKANALLQHQKKEIEQQKEKVETTLSELKSTQAQLIQSEKMASLGELTAGIAHEIQNPLNFVNNFSEVNREMVDEANEEINKGNYDEVKNILNDIKDNEEKINHHGKRADSIVKGMLQHSRQTKGAKEPTGINALCDEYLRLSYHGLRAKDKNFNADFKTDFDESISKINIVPQDIGRVLLNLFNNSFYAVNEKQKLMANGYQPTAEVKTQRINDKIEITVSDNGNGIPQNIVDKIFQPFFTTKPTGQGTGLGLSLAYDIITKEHNGTIKVESKEGEGSVFIILLPITIL